MLAEAMEEGSSEALGSLAVALLSDEDVAVRLAAAEAAGRMRVREAMPALCALIHTESRFFGGAPVREAAVRALGQIGSPDAVPVLKGLLKPSLWRRLFLGAPLRGPAAEALGRIAGQVSERAVRQSRSVESDDPGGTSLHVGEEAGHDG